MGGRQRDVQRAISGDGHSKHGEDVDPSGEKVGWGVGGNTKCKMKIKRIE